MRVALIGNMNNNYFALLRYLRENGVDAELLMYADELEMFKPDNDTWEIEKWQPYIKKLDIVGGALGQYFKMSAAEIRARFEGYDFYIGCGFTPAYFYKAGLQLDVFTPYCVGIEYTYRISKNTLVHSIKEKIESFYQLRGLKKNTRLMATIDEESRVKGARLGLSIIPMSMPVIYNKEQQNGHGDAVVESILERLKAHYPVVLSHVSHFPPGTRTYEIKRNDILIKGFAKFAKQSTEYNSLLVLFEFGEDTSHSKKLVKELEIEKQVMWVPLMNRKSLMLLLKHTDFGGGEFGGAMWGGTGWEFLSMGVPFFQFVDMAAEEFRDKTQMNYPPFFNTNDADEIANKLMYFSANKTERAERGEKLQHWFEQEGGELLALKYKKLIPDDKA